MHLFVETEVSGVEGDRRVDVFDDVTDAHCGHCALLRVVFLGIQNARKPEAYRSHVSDARLRHVRCSVFDWELMWLTTHLAGFLGASI
jgi:hypothetical protein